MVYLKQIVNKIKCRIFQISRNLTTIVKSREKWVDALSDSELLVILPGSGTKGRDVITVAEGD